MPGFKIPFIHRVIYVVSNRIGIRLYGTPEIADKVILVVHHFHTAKPTIYKRIVWSLQ
jgi:hypothetical protein